MELYPLPLRGFVLSACTLSMLTYTTVTADLVAQVSIYDSHPDGHHTLMYRNSPQEFIFQNHPNVNSTSITCENGGFYHELHKCVCKPGFTGHQCEEGIAHPRMEKSTSTLLCSPDLQVNRHDNITSYCSVHDATKVVTCYIPSCDPFLVPIFDLIGIPQDEAIMKIIVNHRDQTVASFELNSPSCTTYLDFSEYREPVFFPVNTSVEGGYFVSFETRNGTSEIPLFIEIYESLSTSLSQNYGCATKTLTEPPTEEPLNEEPAMADSISGSTGVDVTGHHRVKRSTSNLRCAHDRRVKRHDNITSYCSVHDPTNAVTCYIPPCDPFLVPIYHLTNFSQDEPVLNVLIEQRQQVVAGFRLGSPQCTDYLDISDNLEPVFFPARQSVAGIYVVSPETNHGIFHYTLYIFIDESLSPGTPCNYGCGLETTPLVPPTRSESSSTFTEESSNSEDPTTDPKKVNNADKRLDTAWIIVIVIVLCIILVINIKYVKPHGSERRVRNTNSTAQKFQVLCALLLVIVIKPVTGGLVAHLSRYADSDDTEQCSSHPCQHDGRCVDDAEGYHCRCMSGFSGQNCEIETWHPRVKRSTSNLLCSHDRRVKRHDNITSYCSVHDPTNAVTCYIPPCDPFLVPIFDLTRYSQEKSFVSILIEHRQEVIAGIALGSPHCTDYLDISDMFEPVFFPVRQSVAGMYLVSLETKYRISNIPLYIFIDESLSPGTPCNGGHGLEATTLVPPTRSQSSSTFSEESSNTEDPTTDPKKVNNADKPLDTAWIIVIVLFIIVIVLSLILVMWYIKYVKPHGSECRSRNTNSAANGSQVTSSSSPSVDAPFISRNGTSNSY